ncbi:hypothetical protein C0Z01_18155 [Photobacterium kishitanii]|uniref:Uncharacterized protein n=1 Tax=Photobacterium kishitanii TaxID=318456 RepID=A0A0B7JHS7_9GAMM|nr:hypothetical protein [Photobacterium kishitanii]OBU27249.1 hypothetical protein AYY22_03130 [Photobacterium kishitanii]PSU99883.1 hypothetical protein C9J27_06435 [Photobacterium kishitanii]PSV13272.1 hypothetical protein C0W28_17430 [Photobacterium kishitanii]PSW67780.1 hypothetical protein C0Z01_18155 [Photobacterium kishitanii]CEO40922.1 conserved hypothetical protein [Photobacterium kishitanii]
MQPITEKLITLKNAWMASHVTDAEFPTPLSEKGLHLYQLAHSELSAEIIDSITSPNESSLTFYPVDCHPLTIRYALVYSSYWQQEKQQQAIVEYLTQIMFEADANAQLYVGFYNSKPAATGMIYTDINDDEKVSLVSDIHALPLPNQTQLMQDMEQYLLNVAQQISTTVILQK